MNAQIQKNNWIWKGSALLIFLSVLQVQLYAQEIRHSTTSTEMLSPLVKILSNVVTGTHFQILKTEPESESNYFDSSILIFENNLKVCRELFKARQNKLFEKESKKDANETRETGQDTISTEGRSPIVKKTRKSIWNHPGTTKSRI